MKNDTNVFLLKRRSITFAIHPLQPLFNMLIQPITRQLRPTHLPSPRNLPQTPLSLAKAIKWLRHVPLRARIAEGQEVPLIQVPKP